MVRNAPCIVAMALVSVLAVACGGGGATNTAVRTVSPGPRAQGVPVVTGDGSIDLVIDAALRTDDIALAGLTGYQHVACTNAAADGTGGAPACRAGESN